MLDLTSGTQGKAERDQCYQPILDEIDRIYGGKDHPSISIAVPGCGLGRLAMEIARKGYRCRGNEWSVFMLLASNMILNGCGDGLCHLTNTKIILVEVGLTTLQYIHGHTCSVTLRTLKTRCVAAVCHMSPLTWHSFKVSPYQTWIPLKYLKEQIFQWLPVIFLKFTTSLVREHDFVVCSV